MYIFQTERAARSRNLTQPSQIRIPRRVETAEQAKRTTKRLNRLQEAKDQVTGVQRRKDINLQRKYLKLEEKLLAEMG